LRNSNIKILQNINSRFDPYKEYLIGIVESNPIGKYNKEKDTVIINVNVQCGEQFLDILFQNLLMQGYTDLLIEFETKE